MTENCPNCGYDLSNFFRKKIENNLKKEFEEKNKKLLSKHNENLEKLNIENLELKSKLKEDNELLKAKIRSELKSEFSSNNVTLQAEKLKLQGEVQDLKNNKDLEIKVVVQKELQKQKQDLSIDFKLKEQAQEKEILDLKKSIENLKEQANQGSQQSQGEIAEILVENTLRQEFPLDNIEEVPKGVNGADISHYVRDTSGTHIGLIYIEVKNAKKFSISWMPKLREDMKKINANFGMLVTSDIPKDYTKYEKEDLFICGFTDYLLAVKILRMSIIELAKAKIIDSNKNDKKSLVYEYVTGKEFAHWIRGTLEYMKEQRLQLDNDKRSATRAFAIREKQLQKNLESHEQLIGHLKGLSSSNDFKILETEIDKKISS